KEYLGQDTHLAFLAPMWEEVLRADTYARGPGSTVAKQIQGIAGVANVGTDRDWCGSVMNQANWYAFGRLAWDHTRSSAAIADEWIRMTFSNDPHVVRPVTAMLLASREAVVNYMTPMGLAHQMARGPHYGPGPWVTGDRADQTSVYFNRADSAALVDPERLHRVQALLRIQEAEARWWRDASVLYWQSFSHLPLPPDYEAPAHPLDWYRQLHCPPDPRKPRCPAIAGAP